MTCGLIGQAGAETGKEVKMSHVQRCLLEMECAICTLMHQEAKLQAERKA